MIRFLHLSDIHFTSWLSDQPGLDIDRAVRDCMVSDIRAMHSELGQMSAILVAGDIAARGHPDEYEIAAAFLHEVAGIIGCGTDQVVMVPGNHDVDRGNHDEQHWALRQALRTIPTAEISDRLVRLLRDPITGEALLKPFGAYNQFALGYGCDIDQQRLVPTVQQFEFGERHIYVHGYNTAWIADGSEADDAEGLVAGLFQLAPIASPAEGIHIALCHHPPNWLRDSDEIAPWVAQASVVLTGHEHAAGITLAEDGRTLYIASGAVNPSRTESGWIPAYNVIEIAPNLTEADLLDVRVHARSWRGAHAEFGADSADGPLAFTVTLAVSQRLAAPSPVEVIPEVDHPAEPIAARPHALIHEAMSRPVDIRRRVGRELGLVDSSTAERGIELDRLIIRTAVERGQLEELVERMKRTHSD